MSVQLLGQLQECDAIHSGQLQISSDKGHLLTLAG
jgi:hypothetical protein